MPDFPGFGCGANLNFGLRCCMQGGIQQEVAQGLLHENEIHFDERQPGLHLRGYHMPGQGPFVLLKRRLHQVGDVTPVQFRFNVARFQPGNAQQIPDQTI
jgi:hypothetical protein